MSDIKKILEEGVTEIKRESSLEEILETANIVGITEKWKAYLETGIIFETLERSEQEKIRNTVFNTAEFEKLAASTYDLFAPYASGEEVPKLLLNLYATMRAFSDIEYIKSYGSLQFFTSIATALYHMLDECEILLEDNKILIFYMDERQSIVDKGYYTYNFETFLYDFIGEELPL